MKYAQRPRMPPRTRSPERNLVTSRSISSASALVLFIGGVILLFAPDFLLPRLSPGFPSSALWLGQLLGAAWLGMAALNWLSRSMMLGGIYGRPTVFANTALYFISALALLRAASRAPASTTLWALAAPLMLLAVSYAWLLYRGPFEKEMAERRGERPA
jgi:hypothetical protein